MRISLQPPVRTTPTNLYYPMNVSQKEFNEIIIDVIKIWRKTRRIKQGTVAKALCMRDCNYCKIEKHRREITLGQLIIIAEVFDTSINKIVVLAELLYRLRFDTKDQNMEISDFLKFIGDTLSNNFVTENFLLLCNLHKMLNHREAMLSILND